MGSDRTVLAQTWNGNESGTLWEGLWCRDAKGYCRLTICSGVFVPPRRYDSEDAFWAAFDAERDEFHGSRRDES